MYSFSKYTYQILDRYRIHLEMVDSFAIGFTGTVNERPAPVTTNTVDADTLWFAANVNFTNANALVRIRSISPQHEWMANNLATPQDTPLGAVFGISAQALPVLPLISPFFLKAQGKLQHQFTNSAAAATTGGIVTWRFLKLLDPIDGGWDYNRGFKP